MVTVSLKLPSGLLRELKQEAEVRGVPKSAIIRDALESALRKGRKTKKKPSCLDLMGDLVGHFEGPRDLSTNKEHLAAAILSDHEKRQRKNHR